MYIRYLFNCCFYNLCTFDKHKTTTLENSSIDKIKDWINRFIINFNICPFAKPSFDNDQILYKINQADEIEDQIAGLIFLMNELIDNKDISNAFIIFENEYPEFDDYLEFFYTAEAIIEQLNYHLDFQVVSFHPDYQFEGMEKGDPANKRNQSPLPLIHILRIEEVANAIEGVDTGLIVNRNIKFLRNKDTTM